MEDQSRIVGQVVERGSRADRGFVFIQEVGSDKGPNIFAHVASFPREFRGDAFHGVIGRAVSFQLDEGYDGRRRAVRVEVFDEEEGVS